MYDIPLMPFYIDMLRYFVYDDLSKSIKAFCFSPVFFFNVALEHLK